MTNSSDDCTTVDIPLEIAEGLCKYFSKNPAATNDINTDLDNLIKNMDVMYPDWIHFSGRTDYNRIANVVHHLIQCKVDLETANIGLRERLVKSEHKRMQNKDLANRVYNQLIVINRIMENDYPDCNVTNDSHADRLIELIRNMKSDLESSRSIIERQASAINFLIEGKSPLDSN